MSHSIIRESIDINTDLIASLALQKYPKEFPSDSQIENIICDKYKAILPSNMYRPKRDEVKKAIWDVSEKILDNYEILSSYQIKETLDNSSVLKYSRRCFTSYIEFYLSSQQHGSLGYILNQEIGSHPDARDTFFIFYKPEDENSKIWQEIADIMDVSGMKELKCSDQYTRMFKIKNIDDLNYIVNGLEGIVENDN